MLPLSFRWLQLAMLIALVNVHGELAAADPAWKEVPVPDDWKKAPAGDKGHLWYRAKVAVPVAWQGRKLELVVEAIDDAREFYVGGQLVGRLGDFPRQYRSALGETQRFAIPAADVKFGGDNVVAIRVCNIEGRTGFNVAAPVLFGGDTAIRLQGKWETTNGDDVAWANADAATIKVAAFSKAESAEVVN